MADSSSQMAIYISDLCKSYQNKIPIVQGFNMNVKKGTIYSLLGASGCGKTTVISCIVGLTARNSGTLLVLGKKPGSHGRRLGYMPQELALYEQLSVKEIMDLFGRIYNLRITEVSKRRDFLNKLLDLPNNNTEIGMLSGGQRRRVSLSLALIHSPEILVLDEPTVGLDPLLREKIWHHLQNIVNESGTTILLSTHYIEEARITTTLGVMRSGRLIAEDTPLDIIRHHNNQSLQEAVLQLCRKDGETHAAVKNKHRFTLAEKCHGNVVRLGEEVEAEAQDNNPVESNCETNSSTYSENHKTEECGNGKSLNVSRQNSLQRIFGLIVCLLATFMRNPKLLTILLTMSTIQGSITLWAIGSRPRNFPVGIVNYELLNSSLKCDIKPSHGRTCDTALQSCKYLNILSNNDLVVLIQFSSEDDALSQVHLGRIFGYLVFPPSFTQSTFELIALKQFSSNMTIRESRIYTHMDNSGIISGLFLIDHFIETYLEFLIQLAISCHENEIAVHIPLHFRTPVFGSNGTDGVLSFLMPGHIAYSVVLTLAVVTGLVIISDRKQGTFDRLRVAGVSTEDFIISHLIAQGLIVTFFQILIATLVLHLVFGFVINGSLLLYVILCLLIGACGTAQGILVGIICKDELEGLIIAILLGFTSLLYGGIISALENIPMVWRYFSYILPVTLPAHALRSLVVRGVGLVHSTVWPGFLAATFWTILPILISAILIRKS